MGSNVSVDASSPDASLPLLLSDNASLLREIGGDEALFVVDAFDGKADQIIC